MTVAILRKNNGFTLIEIIVSLVLAAILGTILVQYMSTSLTRSAQPILQVQQSGTLNQILENMTADYKRLMMTDTTPLSTFKGWVEAGNTVGSDPYYGSYTVQATYIVFTGGVEAPDTVGFNQTLKITVSTGNQAASALFTR